MPAAESVAPSATAPYWSLSALYMVGPTVIRWGPSTWLARRTVWPSEIESTALGKLMRVSSDQPAVLGDAGQRAARRRSAHRGQGGRDLLHLAGRWVEQREGGADHVVAVAEVVDHRHPAGVDGHCPGRQGGQAAREDGGQRVAAHGVLELEALDRGGVGVRDRER